MPSTRRVAVIGAGAAGLSTSRELRREGHTVAVFERSANVGGAWIYSAAVESDPLSLDPDREIVHSSLYDSLRTNIPRESMGFLDYPFISVGGEEDCRRFPGHREVLRYLKAFARDSGLCGLVRFGSEVMRVEMEGEGRWEVVSRTVAGAVGDEREVFDAVVVCVGHYSEPRVAEIPGIDSWPGKQMHSHNYRVPEPFLGLVVVIIGSSASAADISKDIAGFAKEVHIASRSASGGTPIMDPAHHNIIIHSMIVKAHGDGTVLFQDGSSANVDVIMHCTGYKYHFPFLKTSGIVNVDDNRVGPLYKHVFPPLLAPYLSFVGLTTKIKLAVLIFRSFLSHCFNCKESGLLVFYQEG
ncbi:flavin-containing monooxygenase FMO GS-OX5-like isoform X1 [Phalaenopsis equestris]|uniref:flavin-containing monooxygenase FMO GS-OX5-like isoform X1 n=1 Tax=Phalaenopsis equestris TaxID=78828 RepID=UPI0009E37EE1|nr:flavin-containing monooxygenase FMO GS-OX5-like isoform X1 [Phalaenopsis equestris]